MEESYETRRPTIPAAEEILGKAFPVLDHGFVRLVDYMGGDDAIVQAARVSYGKGTKKVSEDRGLIRYLMRHRHTTPFEMVELKFHAKMPIFVARQWIRHRTANVNEYSGRYSIMDREFYIPEPEDIAVQSKSNRQGRGEVFSREDARWVRRLLFEDSERAYQHYLHMLNEDPDRLQETDRKPMDPTRPMLARELARIGLTLNYYTQWYWKIDLHNLFHFLGLRMDEHAQKEIQPYATVMADMARAVAPNAFQAFEDYYLNSMSITGPETRILRELLSGADLSKLEELSRTLPTKREGREFMEKMKELLDRSPSGAA